MSRRRLVWLLAVAGVLYATGSQPRPVRADTVNGSPTPSCQQNRFVAWSGSAQGVQSLDIAFRITGRRLPGVDPDAYFTMVARWEFSNGQVGPNQVFAGPGSYWVAHHTPGGHRVAFAQPIAGTASFVVFIPGGYGGACFELEQVQVLRTFAVAPTPPPSGAPTPGGPFITPTPSPTGGASPSASPGPSAQPTATAGTGWCPVIIGDVWEWVPCSIAPSPSPSPSPSPTPSAPPACPVPKYGSGSWTMDAWNGAALGCDVWYGYAASGGTWTVTWAGLDGGRPTGGGFVFGASLCSYQASGSSSVLPDTGITGNRCTTSGSSTERGFWFGAASSPTWSIADGSFGVGVTASHWASLGVNHGAQTGESITVGTWTLTVTYTGTWEDGTPGASPSPSPSPSPTPTGQVPGSQWCLDNPDTLPCVTLPPDWGATPPPGAGDGNGDTINDPNVPPDAIATLVADLKGRSPFGELGQIGDAIGDGLSGAAGAATEWCLTLPVWSPESTTDIEGCIPMEDLAPMFAVARGVLLVMFSLLIGVVILRRVTENT